MCIRVGWCGVEANLEQALYWYHHAAGQGSADAQYNLGVMFYNGIGVDQDKREALRLYQKSSEHDYPPALTALGNMYLAGECVIQNNPKSIELFQKAAMQNYPDAQVRLGEIYEEKKEPKKALPLFFQAAQQNHPIGQTNLGIMFAFGDGVLKNGVIAYILLNKAVENGNTSAKEIRDTIARELSLTQQEEVKMLIKKPQQFWKLIENNLV